MRIFVDVDINLEFYCDGFFHNSEEEEYVRRKLESQVQTCLGLGFMPQIGWNISDGEEDYTIKDISVFDGKIFIAFKPEVWT